MNEIVLLQNYLIVGGLLFAIGLVGFLVRRNLIVMFLCAEMMLQGVSMSLIAWGRFHGDWGGQTPHQAKDYPGSAAWWMSAMGLSTLADGPAEVRKATRFAPGSCSGNRCGDQSPSFETCFAAE